MTRHLLVAWALGGAAFSTFADYEMPVPLPDDPSCTEEDRELIERTYELAEESSRLGNGGHGALLWKDGEIVMEFSSATSSTGDATKHAETGLISAASREFGFGIFEGATLYTSEEPCIMCCGAIRGAKLPVFVYGTTALQAQHLRGKVPENPLQCREVFARLDVPITIRGPLLEEPGLELLAEHYATRRSARAAEK